MEKKEEPSKPSQPKECNASVIGSPKVMESAVDTFKKARDERK
jgi:hypothetical protein